MSSLSGRFFDSLSRAGSKILESSVAVSTPEGATSVYNELVPLDGQTHMPPGASREELLGACNGRSLKLITDDRLSLDAVWGEAKSGKGGTAIIFHGNGCTLDSMIDYAEFYHQRGMNALLLTMRGYPGSQGSAKDPGELGWYIDAAAAVRYVLDEQEIPRDKVICHGYSLGGCLAAAAAKTFGLRLTLDHTFTMPGATASHLAKKMSRWIPEFLPKGIVRGALASGLKHRSGDEILETDGANTLAKVRELAQDLFIIRGAEDDLMPLEFGDQFFEARYGADRQRVAAIDHLVTVEGGHWGPISKDARAAEIYTRFLERQGLV